MVNILTTASSETVKIKISVIDNISDYFQYTLAFSYLWTFSKLDYILSQNQMNALADFPANAHKL